MAYLLFFDFSFDTDFCVFLPNAYIAKKQNQSWYVYKKATADILSGLSDFSLQPEEKEVLNLTNLLQRTILLQKFIKKGSSIELMYKNMQQKQLIQKYIEENSAKMLEIIVDRGLFMTLGCDTKDEISKQFVKHSSNILEPFLEFEKNDIGITYHLFLIDQKVQIKPSDHRIELLNNEKAWIVIDKKLVKVAHIKAQHLKPFLNKNDVFIPEKLVGEYFDKFLKEILKKVDISAKGFEIRLKNEVKSTKLHLINDFFANHYKISLEFDYENYSFYSSQNKKTYSKLEVQPDNTLVIYNYKRNPLEEERKSKILQQIGFEEENGLYFLKKENAFASFFHLIECKEELLSEGFFFDSIQIENKKIQVQKAELIFSQTSDKNDWFDLDIIVKQGDNSFHFKHLVQNIRENNPVFHLPDGSVFIIPEAWFSRYGTLVKFVKVQDGKLQLPKNNYALLNQIPELQPKNLNQNITYTPSPHLKATLRPYQQEGVKWLLEHHYNGLGACLADDMGLGKTLQTIALLVDVHDRLPEIEIENPTDLFDLGRKEKESLKTLVILPSSLVFNWYDEAKRFAPHLRCTKYVGNDRKNKSNRLLNYDIVFTSYPIVLRDAKLFQKKDFRYVILDESQRIKNKNSQIFKVINQIKATHKISLSGTPIENSLGDLWAQMQFINPNILGSFSHFNNYFKHGIEKRKDPVVLEELKTIISPFLLRRTKEQVLDDLPEMTEQITYCELSEEQEKWYESEKSKVRNQLLQIDGKVSQFNALNMLMRLRQISNHPKLIDKESEIMSGKYEEVIYYLDLLLKSSQKALIFSSFISHLAIFEQWCEEKGVRYAKLTGSVPTEERKKEVEAFQTDKSVQFFFISLKAGEVGLNLTEASHVLLLDPWWNPFSEKQAIARAHRLGQKNKVHVVRFVSKNTIEEKIINLQQTKKELSQSIVDENSILNEIIENIQTYLD